MSNLTRYINFLRQWPFFDQKYWLQNELGLSYANVVRAINQINADDPKMAWLKIAPGRKGGTTLAPHREMTLQSTNIGDVVSAAGIDAFPTSLFVPGDDLDEGDATIYADPSYFEGGEFTNVFFDGGSAKFMFAPYASFTSCTFKNVEFDHGVFIGATFVNCRFENCFFTNAAFSSVDLDPFTAFENCYFESCDFTKADLTNVKTRFTRFYDCTLDWSKFYYAGDDADPDYEYHEFLRIEKCFLENATIGFNSAKDTEVVKVECNSFQRSTVHGGGRGNFLVDAQGNNFDYTELNEMKWEGNCRQNTFHYADIKGVDPETDEGDKSKFQIEQDTDFRGARFTGSNLDKFYTRTEMRDLVRN